MFYFLTESFGNNSVEVNLENPGNPSSDPEVSGSQAATGNYNFNVWLTNKLINLFFNADFSGDESDYVPDLRVELSDSEPDPESVDLEGMEEHPMVSEKPRKRKRNPKTWKRNILRRKRIHGQEFVNAKGIVVPKINMGPSCKDTCKRKCKVSEEHRLAIFNEYYALGNYTR